MGASSSQIRFKNELFDTYSAISTGRTSIVFKTTAGPVIKQYLSGKYLSQFERDASWLRRLKGTGTAPELLDVDRSRRSILMSDCGEPISKLNAPSDWESQLENLIAELRKNNCTHNDLSEREVLINDGKLRIVDFAFSHEIDDENSLSESILPKNRIGRKLRWYLDDHFVNYIRFRIFGPPPGAEPHCFVLWNIDEHENVQSKLLQKLEIIRAIVYTPGIYGQMGSSREQFLEKFYSGRQGTHGEKGKSPFIVYFVLDKNPIYKFRTNPTRHTQQEVNINMFDLKHSLRKKRSSFLHGSDNIQESIDNLEALSIYEDVIPKSYWLHWRPKFTSIFDFFNSLNKIENLNYVVLRNFESLLNNELEKNSDIDILVDDYFSFKRFSGAIGYKHKRSIKPGPAHEYGGYKIAGHVEIGGREISIDIRYIGSDYYTERWEQNILATRVLCKCIYIPNCENHYYSLLYHSLVHKQKVSDKYRQKLQQLEPELALVSTESSSVEELWELLDEFMKLRNYSFVRPKELSIPLSLGARKKMGITNLADLESAKKYANDSQYFEAMDLLRSLLLNDPNNKHAKRMLAKIDKEVRGSGFLLNSVAFARGKNLGAILPESVKRPIRKLIQTKKF